MQRLNSITLGILLTCSMPFCVQAQQEVTQKSDAQEQSENNKKVAPESGLEVISVTATKRKTKLMETP